MLRNEFIEKIKQISKENLVFIDELGIEDNACREYGWSIEGTSYVETILIKELHHGQIVIMDNINFHKNNIIKVLIELVGCSILFLPTYSPDVNPIEHYWFKIKNEISKVTAQFKDISMAGTRNEVYLCIYFLRYCYTARSRRFSQCSSCFTEW
ncbi:IS630 family transposase [Orientia tsutsugamushi]|nr:IS630 family transposase [Orientia tsutsugamushi]